MEKREEITIKKAIRDLRVNDSLEFPVEKMDSVYPTCSRLKLLTPGWDYRTKIDKERRVLTVTRTA